MPSTLLSIGSTLDLTHQNVLNKFYTRKIRSKYSGNYLKIKNKLILECINIIFLLYLNKTNKYLCNE